MVASSSAAPASRHTLPTPGACPASAGRDSGPSSGLRPGLRVSHNIQLIKRVGSGGMGQVWLARHIGLDTCVAVKFMRREMAEDALNVARFEREAKLAARIKSPHVVEVFDYDVTEDGIPFIVMESLHGRDLETVLHGGKVLNLADTTRVLSQLCKAMSRAHALGVVHRDIKAENIFLVEGEPEMLVKVLDFGVAKDLNQGQGITVSGTTVGTPSYMSPEQLFHPKEIDLRTDLWSAAVLAYRCVTGQFPFEGEGFPSVCLAVAKGEFPSPSTLNRELPAGLDAWFKKAFHKRLRSRFQTADEMFAGFVEELAKAGLVPANSQAPESNRVPSLIQMDGVATTSISGTPSEWCRPRRSRFWKWGAAAVAVASFAVAAPIPERATIFEWASQAASNGATWALQASNASQAFAQGAGALAEFDRLEKNTSPEVRQSSEEDVRWWAPPTTTAGALPDRARELAREAPVRKTTAHADRAPETDVRVSEVRAVAPLADAPSAAPKVESSEAGSADLATIRFGL